MEWLIIETAGDVVWRIPVHIIDGIEEKEGRVIIHRRGSNDLLFTDDEIVNVYRTDTDTVAMAVRGE